MNCQHTLCKRLIHKLLQEAFLIEKHQRVGYDKKLFKDLVTRFFEEQGLLHDKYYRLIDRYGGRDTDHTLGAK